jgi:mitochondrial fission protein ELM1
MGYQNTINNIMATIGNLARSVEVWKSMITTPGQFVNDKVVAATKQLQWNQYKVEEVTEIIHDLNKLHDEVTQFRMNLSRRIIGFVCHK